MGEHGGFLVPESLTEELRRYVAGEDEADVIEMRVHDPLSPTGYNPGQCNWVGEGIPVC